MKNGHIRNGAAHRSLLPPFASLVPAALVFALVATPGCVVAEPAPSPEMAQQATTVQAASPEEEAAGAALYLAAQVEFLELDINQDGHLSGTELAACDCLRYDFTGGDEGGDGIVDSVEFITSSFIERRGDELPWATSGSVAPAAAVPTTSPEASGARSTASSTQPGTSARNEGQVVTEAPLSRPEMLALIRSMPGSYDVSVPYEARKEATDRQVRLVETRGVDFVLDMGTFDQEFYEAGTSSPVRLAISENYRTPGSAPRVIRGPSALVGHYAMGIAGSTTRYDQVGSNVVRTDRDVGFAGGSLVIGADGSYEWRLLSTDDPSNTFRGTWRPATEAEAGTYVGAAVVLPRSYEGADWIVMEHESEVAGEHIRVMRLDQRFRSYLGTRRTP